MRKIHSFRNTKPLRSEEMQSQLSQADMLPPQESPREQATTFPVSLVKAQGHLLLPVLSALQTNHALPRAGPKLSETVG